MNAQIIAITNQKGGVGLAQNGKIKENRAKASECIAATLLRRKEA